MPPRPPKRPAGNSKQLTHFLCIPLVTSASRAQLQASLSRFRNDVAGNGGGSSSPLPSDSETGTASTRVGIPPKAIRPVGTIHLTIGVMSLGTPERVAKAVDLLKQVDLKGLLRRCSLPQEEVKGAGKSIASGPRTNSTQVGTGTPADAEELKVTLRGISSMNHDPRNASVLYTAPVDQDGRLLQFCRGLRDFFLVEDLIVPDTRPLLLHATVLNTIYVPSTKGRGKGDQNGRARKGRQRLTLDVTEILEKYRDMEWLSGFRVEKVAICKMGARKVEGGAEDDEAYVVESEVEMP